MRYVCPLILTGAVFAIFCKINAAQNNPGGTGPNIILIVSDDQGYPDIGCIGTKPLRTPNLDRLATEGTRATSFYVTWPACTPSRSSLLTGRYPQRNGLYDMVRNDLVNYGHRYTPGEYEVSPEMILGLDTRELTLGDYLRRSGYRNGMVGKWDMGQARRYLPLQRGFDDFYGHGNNGIDYYTHERYGIASMFRNNEQTEADRGTYATELFERESVRFIRENASSRFFLYLAFNAPHSGSSYAGAEGVAKSGVQAPKELVESYRGIAKSDREAVYFAAITRMDSAIGALLAALEEQGVAKNTLILFMSDNGGAAKDSNAPLRGRKGTMWEGGIRVPFIAWWPGKIPAGEITDEFLTSLEILPTLCAVTHTPIAQDIVFDGFDMLPVLCGKTPSPRQEMFWKRRSDKAARVKQWKWVQSDQGGGLFDLSKDISETTDLSQQRPDIAAMMQERFAAWLKEMENAEPRGPFRNY